MLCQPIEKGFKKITTLNNKQCFFQYDALPAEKS